MNLHEWIGEMFEILVSNKIRKCGYLLNGIIYGDDFVMDEETQGLRNLRIILNKIYFIFTSLWWRNDESDENVNVHILNIDAGSIWCDDEKKSCIIFYLIRF